MTNYIEIKNTYFGEKKEFNCTLVSKTKDELVIIFQISEAMRFLETNFPSRSKSFGYYWKEKNYNIYHWKDINGTTLLFYFNISKNTQILEDSVTWQDLIVDLVVYPDGKKVVLDQEEIPNDMSKEDKLIVEKTLKEIFENASSITREIESKTTELSKLA
ncbi:MAG: DUF402 domain-containing protein [Nitrososphaerales archaeon]